MAEITINADVRTVHGKHVAALRRNGVVPGVYYAQGEQPVALQLAELELRPLYRTSHTNIIHLQLSDGAKKVCVLREVQFDPITDRPVHFDLYGIREDKELETTVPVVLQGTPRGVKDGGLLQHSLHKVRITCLPKYIPDHIEVAIDGLGIGQSIHVGELNVPNVRFLENERSAVVGVVPPTVVKEAAPGAAEEGAAAAEPEVIAKGKKPEEEGEEKEKK